MKDDELLARVKVLQSRLEGADVVTPDRARESLTRLVNSHFRNRDERARFSIPADPRRDDDLLLESFITRSELEWILGTLAARGFSKALSKVQSERDELRREVEALRASALGAMCPEEGALDVARFAQEMRDVAARFAGDEYGADLAAIGVADAAESLASALMHFHIVRDK